MEAAITKYDVQNGAFGIVMDVNSGQILAMATMGTYDPNNYLEIYDTSTQEDLQELYDEAQKEKEGSTARETLLDEYDSEVVKARLLQWRNRCVSDGYEPGSTFKMRDPGGGTGGGGCDSERQLLLRRPGQDRRP